MTPFVTSLRGICDQEWQFFGRSRVNLDGTSVVGRRGLGKAGDLTDGSENWFVAIQCNL